MVSRNFVFGAIGCITYLLVIGVYFQHVYFDNHLIRDINFLVDRMISSQICSPVQSEETVAMQLGRQNREFPSPRCCYGETCIQLKKKRNKNIVLTTLRSDEYLPLLKGLFCSLKKSNPKVPFLIATVRGDLSQSTLIELYAMEVTIIFWTELIFENKKSARFALNWVKLRAWEMVQYDAILMVDCDAAIVGDIKHLFSLPTAFAAVMDQDKFTFRFSSLGRMQGGVVLLRPCITVAQHMISLLTTNEHLRFSSGHAEQSFFDWYFRYERWSLPIEYNAIGHLLDEDLLTVAGVKPLIVHYTKYKPFVSNITSHKDHTYSICG